MPIENFFKTKKQPIQCKRIKPDKPKRIVIFKNKNRRSRPDIFIFYNRSIIIIMKTAPKTIRINNNNNKNNEEYIKKSFPSGFSER